MRHILDIVEIVAAATNRYYGRIYEIEGPKAQARLARAKLRNKRSTSTKSALGLVTYFFYLNMFMLTTRQSCKDFLFSPKWVSIFQIQNARHTNGKEGASRKLSIGTDFLFPQEDLINTLLMRRMLKEKQENSSFGRISDLCVVVTNHF